VTTRILIKGANNGDPRIGAFSGKTLYMISPQTWQIQSGRGRNIKNRREYKKIVHGNPYASIGSIESLSKCTSQMRMPPALISKKRNKLMKQVTCSKCCLIDLLPSIV